MLCKKTQKGFTLIEILIAASLFVVVISITTMILFDIITTEKRTNILNAVYDDSRVVMEQLATLIHENAIDYDEYYSVNVIQPSKSLSIAYGMYHGVYSGRFYDPGLTYDPDTGVGIPGTNPKNLGVECSDIPEVPINECKILYKLSKDKNTGKNPYEGSMLAENTANAFCDGNISSPMSNCDGYKSSEEGEYWKPDELFLISPDGTEKTIIGKQLIKTNPAPSPEIDDTAIGILELNGIDSDQNGMMDLFTCAPGYICEEAPVAIKPYLVDELGTLFPGIQEQIDIPEGFSIATRTNKDADLAITTSNFIPITPFRSTVADLKFIITPVEDPYKAYAEQNMQSHPSVTILLKMQPSAAEKARYPGQNPPPIIIQRTVTAGVHGKVESYPPTNDLEWISEVL